MDPATRTASHRRYCRQCGALAIFNRSLCVTCQDAEVRMHLRAGARRVAKPEAADVQEAYAASLPVATASAPVGYAAAVMSGTAPLDQGAGTLSHAQRFGATLAVVPGDTHAAEVFFAYSRRAFYLHVRSLLRSFDPRKRLPTRRRDGDQARQRRNEKGNTVQNRALAKALRLTRIYLQMEMVPLALKVDCSQSQIWHLETGNNVVLHKWVERYAKAFDLTTDALYRFAAALGTVGDCELSPIAQLRMFYTQVLGPQSAVSVPPKAVLSVKAVTGAATHKPRETASANRTHPGTGYPMNQAVGQALRYVRMRAEMDVPEFAATAGMSPSHVYNMECDRKTVGNHIVEKYAAAVGCESRHLWELADRLLEQPGDVDDVWLREQYDQVVAAVSSAHA